MSCSIGLLPAPLVPRTHAVIAAKLDCVTLAMFRTSEVAPLPNGGTIATAIIVSRVMFAKGMAPTGPLGSGGGGAGHPPRWGRRRGPGFLLRTRSSDTRIWSIVKAVASTSSPAGSAATYTASRTNKRSLAIDTAGLLMLSQ